MSRVGTGYPHPMQRLRPSPLSALLHCSENESLWREVAGLRQKHAQQQKVVNKVRGGPAGRPVGPLSPR